MGWSRKFVTIMSVLVGMAMLSVVYTSLQSMHRATSTSIISHRMTTKLQASELELFAAATADVPTENNSNSNSNNNTTNIGWVRPPIVYGLVHIAKTAGTELNGLLAQDFERVCGNRGYSYDAAATNERIRRIALLQEEQQKLKEAAAADNRNNDTTTIAAIAAISREIDQLRDLYETTFTTRYNRGRVPPNIMLEIGFDDCDYIIHERRWEWWSDIADNLPALELHVPCREPLEHLMSSCNYKNITLDCTETTNRLEAQIAACKKTGPGRISPKLLQHPNISVKCFEPFPSPMEYVEYMGTILQPKRQRRSSTGNEQQQPQEYFHRSTNQPRQREHECLWQAGAEFQNRVRQILKQKHFYYQFCEECLQSKDALPIF